MLVFAAKPRYILARRSEKSIDSAALLGGLASTSQESSCIYPFATL